MSGWLIGSIALFATIAYTYIGYPLLISVIASVFGRVQLPTNPPIIETWPDVAIVITMHNGAHLVAEKLRVLSQVHYPGKLSVNFILDGCSDDSESQILGLASKDYPLPVRIWPQHERNGKEAAIRASLQNISEPILMFSDADAVLGSDSIRLLVEKLHEEGVGVACGREIHHSREPHGAGAGQGLFYRYEEFVKRQQERVTSLAYVQGGVFAMWKYLYPPKIPVGATQDGAIAFHTVLCGKRVAFVPDAISEEFYDVTTNADFARRIRTISRAFFTICSYLSIFLPHKAGLFGLHVLSSRVLRWLTLPLAIVANLLLIPIFPSNPVALTIVMLELLWCFLALLGYLLEHKRWRFRLAYFCYYFTYIHFAAAVAILKVVTGQRVSTWKPTAS